MNLQATQDRFAALDAATGIEPTLMASGAQRGVRIDVCELSRRVRVRTRGDVTLVDGASFTLCGR